jgi:hypothetical protein
MVGINWHWHYCGEDAMKEGPILFSAPMVRAILDGSKTQTRRIMREQVCEPGIVQVAGPGYCEIINEHGVQIPGFQCPYGQPGDRLWVRETCRAHELTDQEALDDTYGVIDRLGMEEPPYGLDGVIYEADGKFLEIENSREASEQWGALNAYRGKRGATVVSIHMPRWASRITLEITSVRVERLQDISEADARAEGIADGGCLNCGNPEPCYCDRPAPDARDSFVRLWQSINGEDSWATNPWVWVVEFKMVNP